MNEELSVFELRQYTLVPGGRDVLIDLFERSFITEQERVGAHVIGHFRDLDDPDRFVWLRGFGDMVQRRAALEAFYTSDVWNRHRDAANETMLDSDNVLLLRTMPGFVARLNAPVARDDTNEAGGLISATIWPFAHPVSAQVTERFVREIVPLLEQAGADVLAAYVTEPSVNDYPRLPVREGENVLVWLSRFADDRALDEHEAALCRSACWQEFLQSIEERRSGAPQGLRLAPCARSLVS